VLAAASRITAGDYDSWYGAWNAVADRVAAEGADQLARGHRVSARDSFLRAMSNHVESLTWLTDLRCLIWKGTSYDLRRNDEGTVDVYALASPATFCGRFAKEPGLRLFLRSLKRDLNAPLSSRVTAADYETSKSLESLEDAKF
jgi:hypothetical protein